MMKTTDIIDLPLPRSHPLDPPPKYRELAAGRPLQQVRTPLGDLAWVVWRYEDARAVLADPRFSADPRTPGYPTYMAAKHEPLPGFFMMNDAPDHPRLRRHVSREFVTATIEAMRPWMEEVLDGLIDEMVRAGDSAELIRQVAAPMASMVICELLGVPTEDRDYLKTLVDKVARGIRREPALLDGNERAEDQAQAGSELTPEEQMQAGLELLGYIDRLVTSKEQIASNDLLGRLVAAAAHGDPTHTEFIGITTVLLLGGYDTLVQMIGLGVLTLLHHPDQLAQLKSNSELISGTVNELLRFLTVNHAGLPRAALEDVVVAGQLIRAHEGVLVMINAANRDATAFPDPDTFDIHRSGSGRHLALGHGLHRCIGGAVAKVELETVLSGLFRRLPDLRVTQPIEELKFRHTMVLYGVEALPVTW